MRGRVHLLGTLLAVAGALTLVWALLVWQWQDPFTALYTTWKQHQLASQYDKRAQVVHDDDLRPDGEGGAREHRA